MADCVFPTRTARFGVALTFDGPLNLRLKKHSMDLGTLDPDCPCPTCQSSTSRAFLHHTVTHETAAAHALTLHNIAFQAQVMGRARDAILEDRFPAYLHSFFSRYYNDKGYPEWCVNALRSVGVDLFEHLSPSEQTAKLVPGQGAVWDYA
jgi:tRNA-guanine family transglycosylase